MAAALLVFVCEGPTCSDKWGAGAPRAQIARQLAERGLADRVHLESEICFGYCQRGANLITQPFTEQSRWSRPDPFAPGAGVHHDMDLGRAVRTIVDRLVCLGRVTGEDLTVAANPEVA